MTEVNLELSKNLKFTSIYEEYIEGNKLLSVECYFMFFDTEGVANISINNLDSEYPSYGMTEIESDLSDSFNSLLEDYWFKISERVKQFVKEWESKQ